MVPTVKCEDVFGWLANGLEAISRVGRAEILRISVVATNEFAIERSGSRPFIDAVGDDLCE